MDVLPVIPSSCDGCGVCCLGIGSPIVLYASRPHHTTPHPFRPPNLPQELIDEINRHFSGLLRGQEPQAQCLWFDATSRLCKHHEYRPQVCRDFELGGLNCLTDRREAVLAGQEYPLRSAGRTTGASDSPGQPCGGEVPRPACDGESSPVP